MKSFVCSVCGYIPLNGVIPDICPVCHSPKNVFKEQAEAIKEPKDLANLTELEKKHIPVIVIEKKCGLIPQDCLDVNVKIGEIEHPMLPEHSIGYIDFYIDSEWVSRVTLTPQKLNPAAGLHLNVGEGNVSVIASCNVHGKRMNEKKI